MFNITAANAACKMFDFVEKIASEFERAGFKVDKAFQKRWWEGECGIYISCEKECVLWLGIWADFWKDHGCPLCIGVRRGKWAQVVID